MIWARCDAVGGGVRSSEVEEKRRRREQTMTRLAAWKIVVQDGDGGSRRREPRAVQPSKIRLEKHLEDWIVNDVTLIGEGLTLAGRQISIDDGRLDLLALDSQDRWVVIEIKPGMPGPRALAQALSYAASLARLDADEVYEKLKPRLGVVGDAATLSTIVKRQLADEGDEREIAVLLVGVGTHSGLERTNEFLARFGVPIGVVSFEVFDLEGGSQLLVREVVDEPTKPPSQKRRYTVEAIRSKAVRMGVDQQFDRFVRIAGAAGLPVQPQKASVRIAPPADRTRFLMYARPVAGAGGGGLAIWVGPKRFAEWFSHIGEDEATAALGKYGDGGYAAGKALHDRLDQIERFLTKHFPPPDGDGE
ncbi:endonuclease NucS domain-containing protein [Candidatus Palauibacter sp.]|uniref:endonuclease NucS domain-containing protein n=1 Tax=Candidatus Palauibacter sp. TaxID=3101350 RepID=UPI003CC67235